MRTIDDALLALAAGSDDRFPASPAYDTRQDTLDSAPLGTRPTNRLAPTVQPAPAVAVSPPVPPPPSVVTYALLPGRWQLDGAHYVWVLPETTPRLVQARPLVPGTNVWQDGRWVWVPPHDGNGG